MYHCKQFCCHLFIKCGVFRKQYFFPGKIIYRLFFLYHGQIVFHRPLRYFRFCSLFEFKGADSKLLLARCVELLREKGYAVGNVDCTISMQRPKLRPHIDRMRETIARTIGIDTDAVSVKATTTERLGFEGREEGVSVAAVALIYRE